MVQGLCLSILEYGLVYKIQIILTNHLNNNQSIQNVNTYFDNKCDKPIPHEFT